MSRVCLSGRTIACGAAAMLLPLAALAQVAPQPVPDPKPINPAPDAQLPKLKWPEVCGLAFVDNRLILRCTLSLDTLRHLDSTEREVDGIPGLVSCNISFRNYLVENTRRTRDGDVVYRIYASKIKLSLEMEREINGRTKRISFTQGSYQTSRRSVRGSDCQLTASGPGVEGEINVEASDLTALKRNYPHEVNRFLRPLLHELGWDLFAVDAAVARQVLFSTEDESESEAATQPADVPATRPTTRRAMRPEPDPKLTAQVRALLKDLDTPVFAKREAAAQGLARLGPPALGVFDRLDRERLSAQQNLTLDLLEALVSPVSVEEARRLRSDLHFLADCFYLPDADIRTAAAERIARLGKAKPQRLEPVVAVDPKKNFDGAAEAIEKLREEIIPPTNR